MAETRLARIGQRGDASDNRAKYRMLHRMGKRVISQAPRSQEAHQYKSEFRCTVHPQQDYRPAET